MKKTTLLATVMGLALVFGTATNSQAWCLFGCADVDNSADRINSDNINGDQVGGDKFDQLAETITDSFVLTNNSQVANSTTGNIGNVSGAAARVDTGSANSLGNIDKSHNNDININTIVGNSNNANDNR